MESPVFVLTAIDGMRWLTGEAYREDRNAVREAIGDFPRFDYGEPGIRGIWVSDGMCYPYAYLCAHRFDVVGRDAGYLIVARIPLREIGQVDLGALLRSEPFMVPRKDWPPEATIPLPSVPLLGGFGIQSTDGGVSFGAESLEGTIPEERFQEIGAWLVHFPQRATLLARLKEGDKEFSIRYIAPPLPTRVEAPAALPQSLEASWREGEAMRLFEGQKAVVASLRERMERAEECIRQQEKQVERAETRFRWLEVQVAQLKAQAMHLKRQSTVTMVVGGVVGILFLGMLIAICCLMTSSVRPQYDSETSSCAIDTLDERMGAAGTNRQEMGLSEIPTQESEQ